MSAPPSRVIPVVRGAAKPYLMGATRSGAPIWTDSRTKALGWSSETEAATWIDSEWPELRTVMKRKGTPIIFETVALEVKPLEALPPRVQAGAGPLTSLRATDAATARELADCACPELCLVHPPLGLTMGGL